MDVSGTVVRITVPGPRPTEPETAIPTNVYGTQAGFHYECGSTRIRRKLPIGFQAWFASAQHARRAKREVFRRLPRTPSMPFSDKELLHGAALAQLVPGRSLLVRQAEHHDDAYEIQSEGDFVVAILKYTTRKRSPWQFSFGAPQVDGIKRMHSQAEEARLVLGLICHTDGVCALFLDEIAAMGLTIDDLAGASLSVRRPRGGSYWVSGPGRVALPRSIPQNRWARVLAEARVQRD